MKTIFKTYILLLAAISVAAISSTSCSSSTENSAETTENHEHEEGEMEEVHFSKQQFEALGMAVDTLPLRNISSYVEANGQLQVPPQNEATVTAIIGANIISINVIEGQKIIKGQILAYLIHPDLIKLQTDYINSWNQLDYLEEEYKRQKKLYEENVGSGKEFQRVKAEYLSTKGMVQGYEAQLKLMGLNIDRLKKSELYEQVPVISPIDGYIRMVNVKTGQFVSPQTVMFEVVNNHHIHADLMVFEKDMHKVRVGQKVKFTVESMPGEELEAVIFSVGKSFEQDPKAIHLHAEFENKNDLLIPGMYIRGRILVNDSLSYALPEEGLVREGDKYFIFTAGMESNHGEPEWGFKPIEVVAGMHDEGWVEVKLLEPLEKGVLVAWNNAYYLLSEMKKGEAEHSH